MKTAEDILNEKSRDIISVSPDTLVLDALNTMCENKIGSIIVKDKGDIVGIWTERNLMYNTMTDGFDHKTARIGDYMTTRLFSAPHSASVYQLLDIFLGRRLRHLLIEKEKKYIGFLSIGDVVKASLQDKAEELNALQAIFNWEYYEDWKWTKKK